LRSGWHLSPVYFANRSYAFMTFFPSVLAPPLLSYNTFHTFWIVNARDARHWMPESPTNVMIVVSTLKAFFYSSAMITVIFFANQSFSFGAMSTRILLCFVSTEPQVHT
jgi:hypothetical protein